MSDGVTVHGGSDGIAALIDDMVATGHILSAAADRVEEVITRCSWQLCLLSGLDFGSDALGALLAQDALRSAVTAMHGIDHEIRGITATLWFATMCYRDTDDSVFDQIGSAFATSFKATIHLPGAFVDGTDALIHDGVGAGVQAFVTGDPELVDEADQAIGLMVSPLAGEALKKVAYAYFDDGDGAVVEQRLDVRQEATAPPRSLADLMAGLDARNGGGHGEVDVKILTGADGRRHAIVDIPGTKDWTPAHETDDVVGWASNIRAIDGESTTYEKGVLEAMKQAGVRPTDDVMVVGHSLGGMVAVTVARDAARSGKFNVTHVVTAGAPIGKFVGRLPAGVQVLALENKHDVIAHLDGVDNPDRPNVTTATFDIDDDSIGDNHGLGTAYQPGAARVDSCDDPAVRAFLASAGGYFGATTIRTSTYVVTRR